MFIALKPLAVRKEHARRGDRASAAAVRPRAQGQPVLQAVQDIRVGGRTGNAQYQFTLQADNLDDLNHWAPHARDTVRQTPVLADVSSDQENRGLQTTIVIDRDAAARLGVQARSIDEALYDAFGQRLVSTIYTSLNQYHVVMEAAPDDQERPEGARSRSTCDRRLAPWCRSARSPRISRTPRRCR